MPRPISGNALSSTERSRRRRERIAKEQAEAEAQARAKAQAERDARQTLAKRIKNKAQAMCRSWTLPPLQGSPEEVAAWERLMAHIDRWQGW